MGGVNGEGWRVSKMCESSSKVQVSLRYKVLVIKEENLGKQHTAQ